MTHPYTKKLKNIQKVVLLLLVMASAAKGGTTELFNFGPGKNLFYARNGNQIDVVSGGRLKIISDPTAAVPTVGTDAEYCPEMVWDYKSDLIQDLRSATCYFQREDNPTTFYNGYRRTCCTALPVNYADTTEVWQMQFDPTIHLANVAFEINTDDPILPDNTFTLSTQLGNDLTHFPWQRKFDGTDYVIDEGVYLNGPKILDDCPTVSDPGTCGQNAYFQQAFVLKSASKGLQYFVERRFTTPVERHYMFTFNPQQTPILLLTLNCWIQTKLVQISLLR